MIITGTDGVLHLANSRTDMLFGYDRDQLIGSNVLTLIPGWSLPELSDIDEPREKRLSELRLEGIRKDGGSFPIEVTCSPFDSDEGLFVTIAVRDATEKVEAEERIQRINADLERRVAERTADLTRSNDALRQFAWAASHDLQEPIRMALSYSQWLSRSASSKLSVDELEMLACVQENASRLGALLTDLRQYIFLSESEDHPKTLVDCNHALQGAKDCLDGALREAGAIIEADRLPAVPGIEILLVQIFQNLISNSIKYRAASPPVVKITSETVGGGWVLSFADNGIGIDPAQAHYVFGVFKRLHGRQYSGTGIGLAICKAAAERLGGRIWVKPQQGPGATIQLFIPKEAVSA
jgi:PAS domain S-box-containing protein